MAYLYVPMLRGLAATAAALACICVRAAPAWEQTLEDDGVRLSMRLVVADGVLRAGAAARLSVQLSTTHDNAVLPNVLPGVWIDAGTGADGDNTCIRRIARYVRASELAPQALVDVNGYDVLVMNAEASVSVIDPRTQLAGRTSLRASIALPGPGFDWAATIDDATLFVSVPSADALAVADLTKMKASATVALPGSPGRVRLAPGGDRVWVGIPTSKAAGTQGGVAIVDARPPHAQRWLPLARGHVDFAFDPAGWVAVTQRGQPRVTFIDPTVLALAHEAVLPEDSQPLAVVFDAKGRRFVVAEARHGRLHAFGARGLPAGELALQPGIGPMSLSRDGRWLLIANPAMHVVDVVDLPAWRHAHRIPVSGRPYEIAVTADYAYVRALDSEAVQLLALASLAAEPRLQRIVVGERAPANAPALPIAAAIAPMPAGRGSFVVSPADNSVYFYMEGMNAPAGSVSARGSQARAVRVARRGLRETAPGLYEADIVLPAHERLVLAVATEVPRTRLCTTLDGVLPASMPPQPVALHWEVLPRARDDARIGVHISGIDAAELPSTLALKLFTPGGGVATELRAEGDGRGRYVARLPGLAAGLWYVHAALPRGAGAAPYASFVLETPP